MTGPALRRFGIAVTVLVLPLALGFGTALIVARCRRSGRCSLTNAFDQGFRFSVDKASYELLYLPIAPAQRIPVKNAIDIVVNRVADAFGAVLLGLATQGFFVIPGLGLGLRGTAAINLVFIGAWLGGGVAAADRVRPDDSRRASTAIASIPSAPRRRRSRSRRPRRCSSEAGGRRCRRGALCARAARGAACAELAAGAARAAAASRGRHPPPRPGVAALPPATAILARRRSSCCKDADLGVRTEALLYLTREMGVDPLAQIREAWRLRGLLNPRRDGGVSRRARTGAESRRGARAPRGDGPGHGPRRRRANAPRPRG